MNNEKTHLIIGDRQVGKTTRLIKESYEKGIPIVVWCNDYAKTILNRAKEMNISIPDPVVVTSAIDLRGLLHVRICKMDALLTTLISFYQDYLV